MRRFSIAVALAVAVCLPGPAVARPVDPPRVLLITAHPDDETLFNLGRFAERGWPVAVALVTNGEGGSVVQAIRGDYDPHRDPDVLIEAPPGPEAWVVTPPDGPRLRPIQNPTALARQRRDEFLATMARHRVSRVYFLSGLRNPDFEDSWDRGIAQWDRARLRKELTGISRDFRPDVIVTLNPGETWAHPQHIGLGALVEKWFDAGRLRADEGLYGLREIAWYPQSLARQAGDVRFQRGRTSPVLRATYEAYWTAATSAYMSQSSHPVWLQARADAGLLPGYRGVDVIRHLSDGRDLKALFRVFPRDKAGYTRLPRTPRVIHE